MRILQLSTYPTQVPRHGGQARIANIRATLSAPGHDVRALAVYEPENYGGDLVGRHDIAFPQSSPFRDSALPYCTDYASGDFLAGDPTAYGEFAQFALAFAPDAIMLEQPWLLPAVERLRREHPGLRFRLVYSSQNIEAPLKREILDGLPADRVDAIAGRIELRQRAAARAADLTIAVTDADRKVLADFGARRVIVAHNGIVERELDPKVVRDWTWFLGSRRFALFVGSAYPPNGIGFWNMFGPSLAFLAPDQCILAVGGVSGLVPQHPMYKAWEAINASRLELAGIQSEEALAALLALAHCIVLPITRGGGSNIKTAEAIRSGKPVIGTSKSFRGYEATLGLPHVYRTDDAFEFRNLTKAALEETLPVAGPDDPALRRSVLWSETLAELPREFAALAAHGIEGADGKLAREPGSASASINCHDRLRLQSAALRAELQRGARRLRGAISARRHRRHRQRLAAAGRARARQGARGGNSVHAVLGRRCGLPRILPQRRDTRTAIPTTTAAISRKSHWSTGSRCSGWA